jgi:hypothetical protein
MALISCTVLGSAEGKFAYSQDCGLRNHPTFPVSFMQRELPHVDWNCDLGKLHVSIFPRLNSLNVKNLCCTDPKARAILLWDSPSIEFVKDYLSVVCIGFDPLSDVSWWKNKKAAVLPF